ncbi:MAG: hypothetical protein RE472_08685 [Thermoplasmatales archaeon]|nr:MAG: hypothetical protein RE472_08685 [Thermoplasmatales archaeon]
MIKKKFYDIAFKLQNLVDKSKQIILIDFCIATFYTFLFLFFSHGKLYIGGDNPGYYSLSYFAHNFSIYQLFYPVSYLISNGNIYATYNIQRFLNMLLTFLSISFFVHELFKGIFNSRKVRIISSIAVFIYPLNLGAINVVWQTFFNSFEVPVAFLILFIAIAIKIGRDILENKKIDANTVILGGIFLGIAAEVPYPNLFRIAFVGLSIMMYFVLMASFNAILWKRRKFNSRNLSRGMCLFLLLVTLIFIINLASLWPIIINYTNFLRNSKQLAAFYTSITYNPSPINSFQNTIRLIYSGFLEESPYYIYYLHNPIIIGLSYIWPFFVFILAPLISFKRRQSMSAHYFLFLIVISDIMLLLMVIWDSSVNPPFGFIVKFLVTNFPLLFEVYQVGFFSGYVIPVFYSALLAYVIFEVYSFTKEFTLKQNPEHSTTKKQSFQNAKRFLPIIISILIIFLLIVAAFPLFNGQVEGEFFNEGAKGTTIPHSYFTAKEVLLNSPGNTLLFPGTSQYVQTSWNYQGTIDFYNSFFYPVNITTYNSFGAYESINSSFNSFFANLTNPLTFNGSSSASTIINNGNLIYSNYGIYGANGSSNYNNIDVDETNSGYVHITTNFLTDLNLSQYPFTKITYNFSNSQFFENAVRSGYVDIGLSSSNGIAWWTLTQKNTINKEDSLFETYIPLDYGYSSVYHKYNITGFYIDINTIAGTALPSFNISYPKIYGVNSTVNPQWLSLISKFNFKYILLDKTIVSGALESNRYILESIKILIQKHIILEIYNSNSLGIYRFIIPHYGLGFSN